MKLIVLIISATTTALMAGLFFAWSYSVTLGLARLSNTDYISAMQAMNRAIQNPFFFCCFFGALLMLPLSAYLYYEVPTPIRFWLLLSATIVYGVGVMGVTIVGNIPLNQALDAFDLSTASADEMARQRSQFEIPWNRLNMIRTISSGLALVLVIVACINPTELLKR